MQGIKIWKSTWTHLYKLSWGPWCRKVSTVESWLQLYPLEQSNQQIFSTQVYFYKTPQLSSQIYLYGTVWFTNISLKHSSFTDISTVQQQWDDSSKHSQIHPESEVFVLGVGLGVHTQPALTPPHYSTLFPSHPTFHFLLPSSLVCLPLEMWHM